jgi:hypothetical protein
VVSGHSGDNGDSGNGDADQPKHRKNKNDMDKRAHEQTERVGGQMAAVVKMVDTGVIGEIDGSKDKLFQRSRLL